MKGKLISCSLALLLSSGCTLISDGVHMVTAEFTDSIDDFREHIRDKKWAETAWRTLRKSDPNQYSSDYAQGFKDGFAEYLCHGQGEPPPVAPARYRRVCYQTPQGYHAIEDWFAGYRRGVGWAVEGGYRRWLTGPMANPLPNLPREFTHASDFKPIPMSPWTSPRPIIGTPQSPLEQEAQLPEPAVLPAAKSSVAEVLPALRQADQDTRPPGEAYPAARLGAPQLPDNKTEPTVPGVLTPMRGGGEAGPRGQETFQQAPTSGARFAVPGPL